MDDKSPLAAPAAASSAAATLLAWTDRALARSGSPASAARVEAARRA